MQMTPEKIAWWRFKLSNLTDPSPSAEECAAKLIGVQSQIYTAASISLAVRTTLGTHAELEKKFSEDRNFVKTWGQRNTLHLYTSLTLDLMANAFRDEPSWQQRQYVKAGGTVQGYHDLRRAAADYLHERGTCTREEMSAFLASREPGFEAIGSWGGILVDLGRQGQLCLGGYDQEAGCQLLYSTPHWHPNLKAATGDYHHDRDTSNAILMKMYFSAYGPATLSDFCHWRGATLAKAKQWLKNEEARLGNFEQDGETYYYDPTVQNLYQEGDQTAADLPPMLLYRFDPLILAHRDKNWLIEEKHYKKVWRIAAHVEGVVLKQGRIVGVWKFQRKGKRLEFIVHHFRKSVRVGKRDLEKLLKRIADYLGYAEWDWVEEEY